MQHDAASGAESTADDKHAPGAVCAGNVTVDVYKPIVSSAGELLVSHYHLLSAQCISSIGQIMKSVCVCVSESVTQTELNAVQVAVFHRYNMFTLLLDDALKPAMPLMAPLVSGIAGLSAPSSSKEDTLNI